MKHPAAWAPLASPIAWLVLLVVAARVSSAAEPIVIPLESATTPADNPLRGLVPYAGQARDHFPCSLEFDYLPLGGLVVGPGEYNWTPLEDLLNDVSSRGRQTVFRIFLEYPGRSDVIPAYLVRGGLKVHRYVNTNTQPLPPDKVETPDYEDPQLRKMLQDFIAALGARYDGDPRIGFITAGLLGTWGEWHTFPRDELFASKDMQREVLDAYQQAFQVTPVLLRYPAGDDDDVYAANGERPFGYHDDSFAWATLTTGKPDDDWFFMTRLQDAGPDAAAKWRTRPIGGEIRPEAWGKVFDARPKKPIQDFRACVEATHVSWLMDSGMFEKRPSQARKARAEEQLQPMGYVFYVQQAQLEVTAQRVLDVTVEVVNRGVAPFYYDWPVEFALLGADGTPAVKVSRTGRLPGLLPGDPPRQWTESLDVSALPPGDYVAAIRAPNPLPGGRPLRFANRTQDELAPGWLSLGTWTVR